jgi:hypothetical protein
MGIRGELFSTKVFLNNRTYFFNVKENRMGDIYLNVVESKNNDNGSFERQSVIIFDEDMDGFLRTFDEAIKQFEKAVREKRKTQRARRKASEEGDGEHRGGFDKFKQRDGAPGRREDTGKKVYKQRSDSPPKTRKVVVKRKPQ